MTRPLRHRVQAATAPLRVHLRLALLRTQLWGLATYKRVRRWALLAYLRVLQAYVRWLRWRQRRFRRRRLVRESREFVRGDLEAEDP